MDYEKLKTELAKPEYAALSDQAAVDAISLLTDPAPTKMVFGSFRTMAAILTQQEYNLLRAAMTQAAEAEKNQGGTLLTDMIQMLTIPGDEAGRGGGLDFTSEGVIGMLQQFAASVPGLENVPAKIAAYVATYQTTVSRFGSVGDGHVKSAREMMQ